MKYLAVLIGIGAWLKHSQFLADTFWGQAERLSYYVLLPALFLHGLATARLDNIPVLRMTTALVFSTASVAVLLVSARPILKGNDPAFTSVFQGGVRFNNYVGVSAVAGLFGAQGIALAAVANAAIVPTVNILCVLVLARYGAGGRMSAGKVAKQLALNPLVLASFGGIVLQAINLGLPVGIEPVIKALGQASLPLGLLCVGAALKLGSARSWARPLVYSSLFKFMLMPVVTLVACRIVGLEGKAAIPQALPTASSSYIMARQLGGDAPLMAGIIASQTLMAAVALPVVVVVLTPCI